MVRHEKPLCLVCGSEIQFAGTLVRIVHDTCKDTALSETVQRRLAALVPMAPATARKVATTLGARVTASGRYRSHAEVCFAASRVDVSDDRWAGAVAVATGRAPAAAPAAPAAPIDEEALAAAVADAVTEALGDLDERVERSAGDLAAAAAREAVERLAPREVVVRVGDAPPVNVGRAHKQFAKLLTMVNAGCNVWLCGPAGSGKTTAAEQAAKALGLRFRFNGAIDSEYKLSGFVDAQGRIVSTAFRAAYKEGGMYLFDEVDASLPSAVLAFNAALANGYADFPGDPEPTKRHPDFRCVAAANTWGHGATTEYVGRARLDAAFLDRFVQLTWEYDEDLERELATDKTWCDEVQQIRRRVRERGLKVVVSPRATILGCRLLAAGLPRDEVRLATVSAKLTAQERQNLGL